MNKFDKDFSREGVGLNKFIYWFRWAVVFVFFYLIFAIEKLPRYIDKNFGNISFEQFLYHFNAIEGAPESVVKSTFNRLVYEPVLFSFIVVAFLLVVRFFFSRLFAFRVGIIFFLVGVFLFLKGLVQIFYALEVVDYLEAKFDSRNKGDWMSEFYQPPIIKKSSPPQYNLILIYVESLEGYRVKEGSVPRHLLKTIQPKTFTIMPGTQWTLAGMVSSQCGLPLFPVGATGANRFDQLKSSFLPGANCIGDILKSNNYATEYVGGARSIFAGKDKFLRAHGFDTLIGRDELLNMYPSESYPDGWWGYHDDLIYGLAQKRIEILRATGRPFLFSMLTLDTHGPKGSHTPFCKSEKYPNNLDGIFDCSVYQLSNFLEWLNNEGLMKNSVVVVMGDHPFMAPDYSQSILDNKWRSMSSRDVFFAMSVPGVSAIDIQNMNHFDVMPTVLGALGFELASDRAGLGRNWMVLSSEGTTLPEHFRSAIRQSSPQYIRLWEER